MGRYANVDTSNAQIVHVKVMQSPTDESYQQYLDDLADAFRARDRFAMVFNAGDLSRLPSRYREAQSRWLSDTQGEFEGRWVGSAFVIKNRAIRGVLMTLLWVNKPYYRVRVVQSEEEAWAWCRGILRDRPRSAESTN